MYFGGYYNDSASWESATPVTVTNNTPTVLDPISLGLGGSISWDANRDLFHVEL